MGAAHPIETASRRTYLGHRLASLVGPNVVHRQSPRRKQLQR
jgi:hypothetical protein